MKCNQLPHFLHHTLSVSLDILSAQTLLPHNYYVTGSLKYISQLVGECLGFTSLFEAAVAYQ